MTLVQYDDMIQTVTPDATDHSFHVSILPRAPLRNEIEARDAALLEEVTDRAARAIAARYGDGAVKGKIQAHIITALL